MTSRTGLELARLEAKGLACARGGRMLFEDMSFALEPGDALWLRGPNGSGKSSLLRLLAGFLPPAAGNLFPEAALRRSMIAYVGHGNPVKQALSVADNVHFLRGLAGSSCNDNGLDAFGLKGIATTAGRYLSSGQRRRTVLAGVLCTQRPIWLLDEPGVGLDVRHRQGLEERLRRHLREGGIAVVASHGDVTLDDPLVMDFAPAD